MSVRSPRTSWTRLGDVPMSASFPAMMSRGLAGPTHPCRGTGRETGRCPVRIPDGRTLCYYCERTTLLATDINPGAIRCPLCSGNINEVEHFTSADHLRVSQREVSDARTMAQIANPYREVR